MNKKEFLVVILIAVISGLAGWNLNSYLANRKVSNSGTFANQATAKLVKGNVSSIYESGSSSFKEENDVEGLSEYLKVISDLPDDAVTLTTQITEGNGSYVVTSTLPAGEEVRTIVYTLSDDGDGLAIDNIFAQ